MIDPAATREVAWAILDSQLHGGSPQFLHKARLALEREAIHLCQILPGTLAEEHENNDWPMMMSMMMRQFANLAAMEAKANPRAPVQFTEDKSRPKKQKQFGSPKAVEQLVARKMRISILETPKVARRRWLAPPTPTSSQGALLVPTLGGNFFNCSLTFP